MISMQQRSGTKHADHHRKISPHKVTLLSKLSPRPVKSVLTAASLMLLRMVNNINQKRHER